MNGVVCSGPVHASTARLSSATEVANECRRALEGARDLIRSVRLPFFNQRNWELQNLCATEVIEVSLVQIFIIMHSKCQQK